MTDVKINNSSKAIKVIQRDFKELGETAEKVLENVNDLKDAVGKISESAEALKKAQELNKKILTEWGGMADSVDSISAKVKTLMQGVSDGTIKLIDDHIDELVKALNNAMEAARKLPTHEPEKNYFEQASDAAQKKIHGDLEKTVKGLGTSLDTTLQSVFTNAVDNGLKGIKDFPKSLGKAFSDVFKDGERQWKGLMDGWKDGFKGFVAEAAYGLTLRPIMNKVIGSITGVLASTGAAAANAGSGTEGGATTATNAVMQFSNILPALKGFLDGGLYSQTLGDFGGDLFQSLFGGGATYGAQMFGNLGYGMIGNMGASLLGLGGGVGGAVGGTLGSLAGAGIGAKLGTILGMPGGPAGAVIGSFLGTALGGMFGNKKPSDMGQWGSIDLASLQTSGIGGMTGKKFSQQNADFRDAALAQAATLSQMLQAVGGTTSGTLRVHIGNRDGLRVGDGITGFTNFRNNSEAFMTDVLRRVIANTTDLSSTLQTVLSKTKTDSLETISSALQFGQFYESLLNPQSAEATTVAMGTLEAQFSTLYDQANSYGLSLTPLTAEYERQKQAVEALIKAQEAGFASMEAMKATFDSWLYNQSIGSNSSLSPLAKLSESQGNFGDLLNAIRGGDASRTQELLQAGSQLLQLGQAMYASSVEFSLLEQFVRESIGGVARELGIPGYAGGTRSARAGLAWVGERGPELVRFKGGEQVYNTEESKAMARNSAASDARFATMSDDMTGMREDIRNLSRQMGRVANQMITAGKNQ